jgi:hypothetical protein
MRRPEAGDRRVYGERVVVKKDGSGQGDAKSGVVTLYADRAATIGMVRARLGKRPSGRLNFVVERAHPKDVEQRLGSLALFLGTTAYIGGVIGESDATDRRTDGLHASDTVEHALAIVGAIEQCYGSRLRGSAVDRTFDLGARSPLSLAFSAGSHRRLLRNVRLEFRREASSVPSHRAASTAVSVFAEPEDRREESRSFIPTSSGRCGGTRALGSRSCDASRRTSRAATRTTPQARCRRRARRALVARARLAGCRIENVSAATPSEANDEQLDATTVASRSRPSNAGKYLQPARVAQKKASLPNSSTLR